MLNLLYVLLALSVIVSLFGMVNTLVLSVFERTRELGMLRAIGMTRRQVRRMIRHESVITALIGAGLGLPLGLFLAALVTQGLSSQGGGGASGVRRAWPGGAGGGARGGARGGRLGSGGGGGGLRPRRRAFGWGRRAGLERRRQHPAAISGELARGVAACAGREPRGDV